MKKIKNILYIFIFTIIIFGGFSVGTKNASAACVINGASFNPSGLRPAGWYSDSAQPEVIVAVVSTGCEGQNFLISLTESDVDLDDSTDDGSGLDDYPITINQSNTNTSGVNTTQLQLRAGETNCGTLGDPDCVYYIEVVGPTGTANFSSENTSTLQYNCNGASCDSNWAFLGVLNNTNGVPVSPQTVLNTDTTYTFLAPLPGVGTQVGTTGDYAIDTAPSPTNPCPFGKYFNTLIKLFFGICAVLAMLMIIMGGIEYMTSELASSKESGKSKIRNAILGLILGLGAYAILNTLNPLLLTGICLDTLPEVTVTIDNDEPQTAINGQFCTNTYGGPYQSGASWGALFPTLATLPQGVTTNHPGQDCNTVGQPQDCTSIRGLNVSKVQAIKTACPNCELIITGGTECWLHGGASQNTQHHPNSSTIDLSATKTVNIFFTGSENPTFDNSSYTAGGVTCKAEPGGGQSTANHWHCPANGIVGTNTNSGSTNPALSASPASGTYNGTQTVTLSTTPTTNTILYNISNINNAAYPASCTSGTLYTAPITISSSKSIMAISCASSTQQTTSASFNYVIN